MKREPTYCTGETIREGDAVRIGEWDGVVESVITRDSPDWVDYIGEGVMLTGPVFGRIHTKFDDEDLSVSLPGVGRIRTLPRRAGILPAFAVA